MNIKKINTNANLNLSCNAIGSNKPTNYANHSSCAEWSGTKEGYVTSVGSNGGPSYYGTYDQNGNVSEFVENVNNNQVIIRGGDYFWDTYLMSKWERLSVVSTIVDKGIGFRTATINNINQYANFVTISDINNQADSNNLGSVSYEYMINKYEVTNKEYAEFLNSIATISDENEVYKNSMGQYLGGIVRISDGGGFRYVVKQYYDNKPVNFITLNNALRFVNWLHNNKPHGTQNSETTEDGAYDLSQSNIVRKEDAKYFLPNENEWYKAAYYDHSHNKYWVYATKSDDEPLCVQANKYGFGACDIVIPQISATPTMTPTATPTMTPTPTLTPTPQPFAISVTQQPQNTSASPNRTAQFSVTAFASRGETIQYQWQKKASNESSFSDISGAINSTLLLSNLIADDDGTQYQVVMSTPNTQPITSSIVSLSVQASISYTPLPTSVFINYGQSSSISVTATATLGGSLQYQWQQKAVGESSFTDINGATNSSYTISNAQFDKNGNQYRVILSASGVENPVESNVVTLSVRAVISITQQPQTTQANRYGQASFSVNASISPGATISYQWRRRLPGSSSYQTIGTNSNTLSLSSLTDASDNGYVYSVIVSGNFNANSQTSSEALLTVNISYVMEIDTVDLAVQGTSRLFQLNIDYSNTTGSSKTVNVSWGDGQSENISVPTGSGSRDIYHAYTLTAARYTIRVTNNTDANITRVKYVNNPTLESLRKILSFGQIGLTGISLLGTALESLPNSIPTTVTDFTDLFALCNISADAQSSINSWNTINITNLTRAFYNSNINTSLSNWNTSNVTTMVSTFENSRLNNNSIANWNTINVADMSRCFAYSDLNFRIYWNTSNVDDLSFMFMRSDYAQPITLDVSSSATIKGVFYFANNFTTISITGSTNNIIDASYAFYGSSLSTDIGNYSFNSCANFDFMLPSSYSGRFPGRTFNAVSTRIATSGSLIGTHIGAVISGNAVSMEQYLVDLYNISFDFPRASTIYLIVSNNRLLDTSSANVLDLLSSLASRSIIVCYREFGTNNIRRMSNGSIILNNAITIESFT